MLHLFALILLILGSNAVKLQYMSFWEYVPEDFAGWCNYAITNDLEQINTGAALDITHLYDLGYNTDLFIESGVLCNKTDGSVVSKLILNPNYQSFWDNLYPTIYELYYVNKSVFGFFMGDALISRGLSPQSLDFITKFIKNNISDSIIYTNESPQTMQYDVDECGNKVNYTKISPFIDWFSTDLYHINGSTPNFVEDEVKPFFERYVFTKMDLNKQSAICVPGSFGSNVNPECDKQCYDEMCSLDANNYYKWAQNDERIIGFYPWHWNNAVNDPESLEAIGAKHMNLTKQTWIEIGKRIINA